MIDFGCAVPGQPAAGGELPVWQPVEPARLCWLPPAAALPAASPLLGCSPPPSHSLLHPATPTMSETGTHCCLLTSLTELSWSNVLWL